MLEIRVFEVFLSIFGIFSHEVVRTSFVFQETWHTTLFGIDYFVEMVRIANNSHMLGITCQVAYLQFFLIVFGTFSPKVVETWFVCHETWHTTLFGVYYYVEQVRIENNSHMLEISVFEVFFKHFWHFLAKGG